MRYTRYWEAQLDEGDDPAQRNMEVWIRQKYERKQWASDTPKQIKHKTKPALTIDPSKTVSVSRSKPQPRPRPRPQTQTQTLTQPEAQSQRQTHSQGHSQDQRRPQPVPATLDAKQPFDLSQFQQQLSSLKVGRTTHTSNHSKERGGIIPPAPAQYNDIWSVINKDTREKDKVVRSSS